MAINIKPAYRLPAAVAGVIVLLIGSFLLGLASAGRSGSGSGSGGVQLTASGAGGKITVTGTGTVTGTPDQLVLTMGVQVNAGSVGSALQQANQATSGVIAALKAGGVRSTDIQTSGLSIQPNYRGSGQVPIGYGVSEQLTATLDDLARAGSQIQAAVTAGGNATTVQGISLNISDTGALLRNARGAAVRDAQAKAAQFARALGHPLGAVVSVSDQTSYPIYPLNFAAGASGIQKSVPVPVSPGSQQLSVQITVVYSLG